MISRLLSIAVDQEHFVTVMHGIWENRGFVCKSSSLTCMSTDDKLASKSSGCKSGIDWDCN